MDSAAFNSGTGWAPHEAPSPFDHPAPDAATRGRQTVAFKQPER